MVGRKAPLRYTCEARVADCRSAVVGRKAPLRYTRLVDGDHLVIALWLVGKPRSDTLDYHLIIRHVRLWLVGKPRSDTLIRSSAIGALSLWLVGKPRSDT